MLDASVPMPLLLFVASFLFFLLPREAKVLLTVLALISLLGAVILTGYIRSRH